MSDRTCVGCGAPIPEGTHKRQRYCITRERCPGGGGIVDCAGCGGPLPADPKWLLRYCSHECKESVRPKNCRGCSAPLPATGIRNPSRWCSDECRRAFRRSPLPKVGNCRGCGAVVEWDRNTKKWCSPECRHAATYVAKPREFPPVDRKCVACDARFVANSPVAQYCSTVCQREFNREARREKERRKHAAQLPARRRAKAQRRAMRRLAKASRGSTGGKTVLVSGACRKCGEQFTTRCPYNAIARHCSQKCRGKGNQTNTRANRRAREKNAFVEVVDRLAVFNRDGWVCGICAGPVNPDVKFPDLMSASLDHVTPLARGGLHEMSNCQLAHFICNSRKSDQIETAADMAPGS